MAQGLEPCFMCGGRPDQVLRVVDPPSGMDDAVPICSTCFVMTGASDDQAIAHLWKGFKEAYSSGYTDSGFVRTLTREVESRGGMLLVMWEGVSPYLAIGLPSVPVSPSLPWVFCRSRSPVTQKMLAPLRAVGCFETDFTGTWDSLGRFAVCRMSSDGPGAWETVPMVVEAIRKNTVAIYGDRDFFTLLANEETNAGYELIRRSLLL